MSIELEADAIEQELDLLVPQILLPLRSEKRLNIGALDRLYALTDQLEVALRDRPLVSKKLTGILLFAFTSMLGEAEHARSNAQEIRTAAWELGEKLQRVYGPTFS